MPSVSLRRALTTGAATAALAGALAAPAGADDRLAFELTPAGGGSYPRFEARAGQTVAGAVRLHSRSRRGQTIRLQALDLVTAPAGGIDFKPGRPRAVGAWLRLDRRDVHLPAGATRVVRYRAEVPRDAAAGEHFAGIVGIDRAQLRRAAAPAGGRGVELRHVTRVALPVRFRLPGRATRRLAAGAIRFAANAGGSRLELDLRSVGQLLVRGTAIDLHVSRSDGRPVFDHEARLSEFVPQTAIRYPIAWRGTPSRGEYRVRGTIRPAGGAPVRVDETVAFRAAQAKRLEEQTGEAPPADGPPTLLLAGLAAAVLFGGAASAGYVRVRRRLAAATMSPAGPSGTG
jgi:hypothetical protein